MSVRVATSDTLTFLKALSMLNVYRLALLEHILARLQMIALSAHKMDVKSVPQIQNVSHAILDTFHIPIALTLNQIYNV